MSDEDQVRARRLWVRYRAEGHDGLPHVIDSAAKAQYAATQGPGWNE